MILPSQVSIQKIRHYVGHVAGIFCIEQGLSANTVLSGGGDGVVAEWDLNSDENGKGIVKVPGNIFSLLLMADKNLLIAGDLHGGVHTNDLAGKQEIGIIGYPGGAIYDIKRLNQNHIVIGAGNGNAYIRNVDTNEAVTEIEVSDKSIRAITISQKRNELIFACSDFNLYVYDATSYILKHVLSSHNNSVFSSAFNSEETQLVSGSRDAQLKIWDVNQDYKLLQSIPAHMYTVNHVVLSPDGQFFATGGRDKHIKIWDASNFNLLKVIDLEKYGGHSNSVNKLFWSKWNNFLISCGDDRIVMVWEVKNGAI